MPTQHVQTLEPRTHLSVSLGPSGLLAITGTNRNDRALLAIYQNQLHVRFNGQTQLFDPDHVQRIRIRMGRGNDHVIFGATNDENGAPFPAGAGPTATVQDVAAPTIIVLGTGDDFAVGAAAGNNRIFGGPGNDILHTLDGHDFVDAGAGNDNISSQAGSDSLYGGDGHDIIMSGPDHDLLDGGNGNDSLYGFAGRDVMYGGAGKDILHGGDDHDTLNGGTGNDRLHGEAGVDALFGDKDGDVFQAHEPAAERKDFDRGDVID